MELARLYGVQGSYVDLRGWRRRASRDAVLAVLRALEAPVDRLSDVPNAIRERREARAARILEPVAVAWEGTRPTLELRLPAGASEDAVELVLELETAGQARVWRQRMDELTALPPEPTDGSGRRRLTLGGPLPLGYHRLRASVGAREASCLLISAPRQAFLGLPPGTWGAFLPLHALWSRRSWGVGDLSDLRVLRDQVTRLGGRLVGTLPMFAAFLRDPVEPSPYSPVSRLFWNELFLDVESTPEFARSPGARDLAEDPETRRALARLRETELVEHREVAALKRRVMELMAEELDRSGSARRSAMDDFAREHSSLDDYARFRAAGERWGVNWRVWPGPARDGRLEPSEVDPAACLYHRYAQFATEEQLDRLREGSAGNGGCLYLDMPLGVHPDGYDVWRRREGFAPDVSVGAPPDDFFAGGQDWGFPPPHPDRIREEGYGYQIACLARVMRHAAAVRIDHVMGLHRLFWVPHGLPAARGVYVRYRPEEWYAILALESHRAGTTIVGEDLGTVPPEVRAEMRRHGLLRSFVLQMEAGPEYGLRVPGPRALACLNTHDMAPFASWWNGTDIERRVADDQLSPSEADEERARRTATRARVVADLRRLELLPADEEPSEAAVLRACLRFLGGSDARVVVVNLEDLWGEREPQNLPGVASAPSWRRRAAHELEEIPRLAGAAGMDELATLRRDRAEAGARRRRRGPT